MTKKSVDIIIPIYNIKNYIKPCVESVIRQSYKYINIILVDDGSNDGSKKICDDLAKIDDRIIVYHKSNGGLFDARNYGLNHSNGDFVYFLDGDDYLEDTTIEELVNNQLETDADVVFAGYKYINIDGSVIWTTIPERKILTGEEKFSILFKTWLVTAWGKLYTRKTLDDVRFKPFRRAEDIVFYYDFAKVANKISLLNKPLYFYINRETSISNKYNLIDHFIDVEALMYLFTNLLKDGCSKILTDNYQILLYRYYMSLFLKSKKIKMDHILKKKFREYDKKLINIFDFKYKLGVMFKRFLIKLKPENYNQIK